jgi:hypothetical protein
VKLEEINGDNSWRGEGWETVVGITKDIGRWKNIVLRNKKIMTYIVDMDRVDESEKLIFRE